MAAARAPCFVPWLARSRSGAGRCMGDQDLTGLPSHRILLHGVTLMPQGGGVFPALSVKENLLMGAYCLRSRSQRRQAVEQQLDGFPRLRERLGTKAGQLSGGEQMMLSIARSLMLDPKFILFDEPSAGLSPKLVTEALHRVSSLAASGVGVLMVEQNIQQALRRSEERRGGNECVSTFNHSGSPHK